MSVTFHRDEVSCHEAGHVAGLVMSGRLPAEVSADRPEHDLAGVVRPDLSDGLDRQYAVDLAVAVLLGPLAERRPGWPPEWPLDQSDTDTDVAVLRVLIGYLKADEADYLGLVKQAHTLARSDGFKRLVGLIATALMRLPALDADQLRRLLGPDLLRKHGIDPALAGEQETQ